MDIAGRAEETMKFKPFIITTPNRGTSFCRGAGGIWQRFDERLE